MNRRLFLALVSTFLIEQPAVAASENWQYEMGWRYVKYWDHRGSLVFSIEPMVNGPDVVQVPDSNGWRSKEALARLKSVQWHRKLSWIETQTAQFLTNELPIPGSLESTPGGKTLESYRLFHPTSKVTHDQARGVWHTAVRRFAEASSGQVTVFSDRIDLNSVFGAVELPALRANPNVILEWR